MTKSNNNNNESKNFSSHNNPLNSLITSTEGYVNKRKKLEPIPLLEGIEEIRNDFETKKELVEYMRKNKVKQVELDGEIVWKANTPKSFPIQFMSY